MTRLDPADVACWVVKSAALPQAIAPGWSPGEVRTLDRCLRASYRLGLLLPGAPCLLWVSGRDRPGVHAVGELAGVPDDGPSGPLVRVRFVLLERHVPRQDLIAHPHFAGAEVARMPAGSNPSWLSAAQFAGVLAQLPRSSGAGPAPPGTMVECVATGSGGERSAGS